MKDRIVILAAAAMIAGSLIVTHPPSKRVTSNAIVANPHFAMQFTTNPDKPYVSYQPPGGEGGFFSSLMGSLFGSWAGTWVAQNFR
jgi:hypothetical protein